VKSYRGLRLRGKGEERHGSKRNTMILKTETFEVISAETKKKKRCLLRSETHRHLLTHLLVAPSVKPWIVRNAASSVFSAKKSGLKLAPTLLLLLLMFLVPVPLHSMLIAAVRPVLSAVLTVLMMHISMGSVFYTSSTPISP